MDKKWLKNAFSVVNVVRVKFSENKNFVDSNLKEECEQERMTPYEVNFYQFESKKLVWINTFVLGLVLKCFCFGL